MNLKTLLHVAKIHMRNKQKMHIVCRLNIIRINCAVL